MRKTTKKLLSSALAGLFVLSSLPLMGAAEAEGNVALKFTPGIDGEKDAAYNESYTMHTDAAWGGVDFSFLYDASYIYVYADVKSSEKGIFNSFDLAFMATDAPKDNWGSVGTSCDVVSNPFWEEGNAMDIRHWQNTMNGCEKLGFNLGWQSGNKPAESAVELVDVTPDSEYKLVATDDGAVVEFRIAYTGINEGAAISVSGDTNTAAWSKLWGGTDYTTFVLGDEYKAEVPDDTSAPVTDAPTEPVTDAPTEPVTDAPTEPVTDAPVDPDPETSTIDGVKDSSYNDANVLTNAAGTLYYAPVKTAGVPELHCYIEVPADSMSVFFHIMNAGGAEFWTGSATLQIDVEKGTGAFDYIFGGIGDNIALGGDSGNPTNVPVNDVAVKTIGDKVAVEFAVPSSQIVSGKEYYAAFGVDAVGVIAWQDVYNGDGSKIPEGAGTKIVLGDLIDEKDITIGGDTPVDPPVSETNPPVSETNPPVSDSESGEGPDDPQPSTNIVKKGTPELDGILDDKYLDSAVYRTLKNAEDGEAEFGWSNLSMAKTIAFRKAGIVNVIKTPDPNDPDKDKISYEMLFDYDHTDPKKGFGIDAFTKAETYFLWDDDALYVFSKVYDNKILDFNSELANAKFDSIYNDTPWLFDNVVHDIYPLGLTNHMKITANAGGNVIYDQMLTSTPLGTPTLSYITGRCDRDTAENVRGIVYGEKDENGFYVDGYYTIEMRIPIHNDIKADFLKDGEIFNYGYWIVDGEGNGEWVITETKNINTSQEYLATFKLSGDEAVAPETSAPVTDAPTEPATDAPTDPVTDAPTDPVTDAPTEPVTDAPTDTPEVSDTDEPDVSDTNEPDVSDTNEPDVSDTDEPTPANLGDVTGDGVVNAKDLIRLMKFIAGEEVEIVGTSDINGDKTTNSKDLVALMKLIAAAE